jgi:hypothetical protein
MLMPGLAPGIGFFLPAKRWRGTARSAAEGAPLLAAEIKNRPQEPLLPVLSAPPSHGRATLSQCMIPKSGYRFSEKIMLH